MLQLIVYVVALDWKTSVQVDEHAAANSIIEAITSKHNAAEVPILNSIYKISPTETFRISRNERIGIHFSAHDYCEVRSSLHGGMAVAPASSKMYTFDIKFYSHQYGFKLTNDGSQFRIKKVLPKSVASYYTRLIPGSAIIAIGNTMINGAVYSLTQIQSLLQNVALPVLITFRGHVPPKSDILKAPAVRDQVKGTALDHQVSEEQELIKLNELCKSYERKARELATVKIAMEKQLMKCKGGSIKQMHVNIPTNALPLTAQVLEQFNRAHDRKGNKTPSRTPSVRSNVSERSSNKNERYSYITKMNNNSPGVGDYNTTNTWLSKKGGLISKRDTSRHSYISNNNNPGVGQYNTQQRQTVKGGEIGDTCRDLKWT